MTEVFRNKRVFLTGHTGFKGTWLTMLLNKMGAEVMGYALEPNTSPSMYNVVNATGYCQSVIGELRNRELLEKTMAEFGPDFIFHLAAQPIVRTSYNIPVEWNVVEYPSIGLMLRCQQKRK